MTRKDFDIIADILRREIRDTPLRRQVAKAFCTAMAGRHSGFKTDKFMGLAMTDYLPNITGSTAAVCDDHSWAGESACPHCGTAFESFAP